MQHTMLSGKLFVFLVAVGCGPPAAPAFRVEIFEMESGHPRTFVADSGQNFNYFSRDRDFKGCTSYVRASARWNSSGLGSKSEGGPSALDGGIEYFVMPSLCQHVSGELLKGRAGRTVACEQLEEAIQRGLAMWALRHPTVYFRRVYSVSHAELLIGSEPPSKEQVEDKHSGKTDSTIAFAQLGLAPGVKHVMTTSGDFVPGYVVNHARIQFNPDHCFYVRISSMCLDDKPVLRFYVGYVVALAMALVLGAAFVMCVYGSFGRYPSDRQLKARATSNKLCVVGIVLLVPILAFCGQCGASLSCFSFETILRHEAGHVLGLDHPDIDNVPNLDSDARRGNHIPIDAKAPCKGLQLFHSPSRRIWKSIMVSHGNRNTRQHKLAHDDIGGLYFLYPHINVSKGRGPLPFEQMDEAKLEDLSAWAKVSERAEKKAMKQWLAEQLQHEEDQHVEEDDDEEEVENGYSRDSHEL